jgi:hypothetical protein
MLPSAKMEQSYIVAYVALVSWIPISLVMFAFLRPQTATALALFGAVLLLPERINIDLPVLPEFDKASAGALGALLGCLWKCRPRLRAARIGRGIDWLWILLLLAQFFSARANPDVLVYGPRVLPGLTTYDAISGALRYAITTAVPFVIARAIFRTTTDLILLLRAIVVAGLFYSLFALLEMRLSPQLHNWVYGFHAHQFAQAMRDGGFRPTIFMTHGLDVARFFLLVLVCAVALYLMGVRLWRFRPGLVVLYLCAIVFFLKSTAVLLYALIAVPLLAFGSAAWIRRLGVVLALLVIAFPLLRANGVVPTETILDIAYAYNEQRGQSLEVRFDQEDLLLAHALERPIFGWSGYGRNRLYNLRTGGGLSVIDGQWILMLGENGLFGFAALFGLLTVPSMIVWRRLRRVRFSTEQVPMLALSTVCAFLAVDLLPNALHDYMQVVACGAMIGGMQGLAAMRSGRP